MSTPNDPRTNSPFTDPEWRKVRNCIACGTLFEPANTKHVRCKPSCRRYTKKAERTNEERNVIKSKAWLTGIFAAASELRVAADLMARGWQISRPFSNTCPYDLVAWKTEADKDLWLKVQVKTASLRKPDSDDSRVICSPIRNSHHDLLALVLVDRIIYLADDTAVYKRIQAPPLRFADVLYVPTVRQPPQPKPPKEKKPPREPLPPDRLAIRGPSKTPTHPYESRWKPMTRPQS